MANVEGKATAITVLTPVKREGPLVLWAVFWAGRHIDAPKSSSGSIWLSSIRSQLAPARLRSARIPPCTWFTRSFR